MLNKKQIERYKKQIDEDFDTFGVTKRLMQLEKHWIRCLSHQVMPAGRSFNHTDRIKLRKELYDYINKKKKEIGKRSRW